jgi:hypothetical protein
MFNITVLTFVDRISCFYSLSPFFKNIDERFHFTYTSDPNWCLTKDKNKVLVMMRQFIKPDIVDIELMKKLRAKYSRIAFFHDDAGGGIPRLEILPYVDLFYTKALLKDKNLYSKPLYGKELYSEYYHEKYGVTDPDARTRPVVENPSDTQKLKLSWNIGIGDYPRGQLRQRVGVAFSRYLSIHFASLFSLRETFDPDTAISANRGTYPIHARIGMISRPSITYQRKLIIEKIKDNPLFLTGRVSQKQFNKETANSRIVLSPFGWGELCLRDFEAVRSGALLLKPDMSHLETWPNIFVADETYVPFDWDTENLVERALYYLNNDTERLKITRAAAFEYKRQLDDMPKRFSAIMEEICQ